MEQISPSDVPKNGAVIQIVDISRKATSSSGEYTKFGLKKLQPRRRRVSTLTVISENQSFGSDNEVEATDSDDNHDDEDNHVFKTIHSYDDHLHRPRTRPADRRPSLSSLWDKGPPDFIQKLGIVRIVGENGKESSIKKGAHVVVSVDLRACLRFDDVLVVRDVSNDVTAIPDLIPLQCVSLLLDNAWMNFSMLKEAEKAFQSIGSDNMKGILICNGGAKDQMAPLIVQLSDGIVQKLATGSSITVASIEDDLILWMMKNIKRNKRIQKVQWNSDAYDQVLLERTKDACKGLADVAICLETNTKIIARTLSCIKNDGFLIFPDSMSADESLEQRIGKGKMKDVHIRFAKKEMSHFKELLDLITSDKSENFCLCCLKSDLCITHDGIKN